MLNAGGKKTWKTPTNEPQTNPGIIYKKPHSYNLGVAFPIHIKKKKKTLSLSNREQHQMIVVRVRAPAQVHIPAQAARVPGSQDS